MATAGVADCIQMQLHSCSQALKIETFLFVGTYFLTVRKGLETVVIIPGNILLPAKSCCEVWFPETFYKLSTGSQAWEIWKYSELFYQNLLDFVYSSGGAFNDPVLWASCTVHDGSAASKCSQGRA